MVHTFTLELLWLFFRPSRGTPLVPQQQQPLLPKPATTSTRVSKEVTWYVSIALRFLFFILSTCSETTLAWSPSPTQAPPTAPILFMARVIIHLHVRITFFHFHFLILAEIASYFSHFFSTYSAGGSTCIIAPLRTQVGVHPSSASV